MEAISYDELLGSINGPGFDILLCIESLKVNINNIGVSYYLVKKLSTFPYFEVEFYIPQLIQILVSYESDSMALSEFILEYSEKYPHFCLVVFWHLQAYIFELKNDPNSNSFLIVRSFINELQSVMFNFDGKPAIQKRTFRENLHPALILGGMIGASFALPLIQSYAKPLVTSQGKQQKSFLFKLANFHKSLTQNLTMKNRGASTPKQTNEVEEDKSDSEIQYNRTRSLEYSGSASTDNVPVRHYSEDNSEQRRSDVDPSLRVTKSLQRSKSLGSTFTDGKAHSLPDLRAQEHEMDDNVLTPTISNGSSSSLASLEISSKPSGSKSLRIPITYEQKTLFLHVNYFKRVTEFMMSLQNISGRLSLVPKDARLTSLRAELTIINKNSLPSEIDIPQLLPLSSKQNKKFHKILKLNINEACVLNSAERVPFLLLIEYLSEDMDFNPYSDQNKMILQYNSDIPNKLVRNLEVDVSDTETGSPKASDHLEEADLGDMSVVELSNERQFITNHLSMRQSNDLTKDWVATANDDDGSSPDLSFEINSRAQTPEPAKKVDTKDLSTQVRIAAVMLQQLEKSGRANSEQSMAIKFRIIESMKALQDNFEEINYQQIAELNDSNSDAGERKLENDFKLGEDWATKKSRIRRSSPYGHLKNWDLCSVIVKNGDDLPQEAFACQLIAMISNIWKKEKIPVWIKNMKILITSANAGLVETINNAMSIHSIKKSMTELSFKSGGSPKAKVVTLVDYFIKVYGLEETSKFKRAQDNFAKSLAGYSIICYILQIKDRHNGNIMLDNEGHIIHIDFGFLLSNSPGSVGFEAAPFKLTNEYVELLGGVNGKPFLRFKSLCKAAFRELRKHHEHLVNIVELMQKDSGLPCFNNGAQTSILLKQRFQLDLSDDDCDNYVENVLIGKSVGSVYTRLYDQFQLLTQGIYN